MPWNPSSCITSLKSLQRMLSSALLLVISLNEQVLPVLGASTLWNTTQPMPPLQPKELGVELLNYQYYTLIPSNDVILDLNVQAYQFNSFSQLVQMATTAGKVNGVPQVQLSYGNYQDPSSYTASMLAHYDDQTCSYSQIEGESPYPGYDYYQNLLLSLYYGGIPVYFDYVNLPEYGQCLQYSATPPWISEDLPRDLTYTLTFQESTGHLVIYSLVGTEYCCPGVNVYCPNSGPCNDGTQPLLTMANTTSFYGPYQIFAADSWSDGFFGPYCPFSSASPSSSSGDDDDMRKSTILAIVLGGLLAVAAVVIVGLIVRLNQAAQGTVETSNIHNEQSSSSAE